MHELWKAAPGREVIHEGRKAMPEMAYKHMFSLTLFPPTALAQYPLKIVIIIAIYSTIYD
jgi:hypothetical protein